MIAPNNGGGDFTRTPVKQACTVLFDLLPSLDPAALESALEPRVGPCRVEWAQEMGGSMPLVAGVAQFGSHRIAMLAMSAPTKQETLARTVGVSPMPEEERRALMAHRATMRLLYLGDVLEPVEQMTALYSVGGAMVEQGGLGILNERAALAQPAPLVLEYMQQLGGPIPPVGMWIGVITFARDDEGSARRFLMRTYGMDQFALPDLAVYLRDRSQADDGYHLLINVCLYMVESGPNVRLDSGQTAEFLERTYLFTDPKSEEPDLSGPNGLLVLVEV